MNETSKVLNQDERVIWQGQPQYLPYILSSIPAMIFGLIWTSVSGFILFTFINSHLGQGSIFFELFIGLFVFFGLYMLIGVPIYNALVYKNIWYTITDKRLIMQKGLVGRDFDFVDFDKVESASVNVDLSDKIFGKNSGDIMIFANRLVYVAGREGSSGGTANIPFRLYHITDPYNVFELFKKTSFDVKSDINYPNALRPAENKGYHTEYKPDETK